MAMPDRATSASMSLEEWSALPEDELVHHELQEGMLMAAPRPLRRHQLFMMRLGTTLERQLPTGFEVVPDFKVVVRQIEPATVRVPDLVVLPVDGPQIRVPASDVVIAIEIISQDPVASTNTSSGPNTPRPESPTTGWWNWTDCALRSPCSNSSPAALRTAMA